MNAKEMAKMKVEAAGIFRELQEDPQAQGNEYVMNKLRDEELRCYRDEKDEKAKYTPKSARKKPQTKSEMTNG